MRIERRLLLGLVVLFGGFVAACGSDAATAPGATTAEGAPSASVAGTGGASPSPSASPTAAAAAAGKLGTSAGVATTSKAPDFTALPGAKASFGKLDKAVYEIEVPNKWNGSLVLYAHGFAGFGTEVSVQQPPAAMRVSLIDQGYAWAASSYSENGYTPGIGADDTLALKRKFEQDIGKPKFTYIAGASMGGNVAVLLMEQYPNEFDGGFSMCGAVDGEGIIDYLTSWTAVAEFLSGISFTAPENASNLGTILLTQLPKTFGPPDAPTQKGQQFASVVRNLTGGPRPFFLEGFKEQYVVNFGLVISDPQRKTLAAAAATNVGVTYSVDQSLALTNEALNAGVRRYAADPALRNAATHPDAVETSGKISKPLLTIHGLGDLFVPISQEQAYRAKVDAAGDGDFLVQRAIRSAGHCKFSDAEIKAGFADLVGWVEQGKKPAGDNITGDLSDAGRTFTTPLRPGDPGTK
jgi:pimeloyl-ACP methyl ester carboxylesterase